MIIQKKNRIFKHKVLTMSNTSPRKLETSVSKSSLLDYFDEGRMTEWFSLHAKNILYSLGGLVALFIIVYIFSSSQNSKAEHEYIQAANDFAFFSKADETQDPALANEALTRLKNIMAKHPELHAAYDGSLAQIFLNRAQPEEAKPYAAATFVRVKSNDLPLYNDYAETALLISQQNFAQALTNAKALQQKMNESIAHEPTARSFGDELFALNLLRIAILQQQAGEHKAELQTWQEWKGYAGLNNIKPTISQVDPGAFRRVIQQLAIGSFSLPDYITYRENLLKK